MTNNLQRSERRQHRPKGWSAARRAQQAALIRRWAPWQRSTGPKTDAGKAQSATNALKHGFRSRDWIHTRRQDRHVLRVAASNLKRIKTFLDAPACGPIKYKRGPAEPAVLRPVQRWLGVSKCKTPQGTKIARRTQGGRNSPS